MKNKVIEIDSKRDNLVNFLKKILDMAEKGEISKIMIASFLDEKIDSDAKETLTGYFDLDMLERQLLIST